MKCALDECQLPKYKSPWCKMHRSRVRRHGDPTVTLVPRRDSRPTECHPDEPHFSGGMCKSCYRRAYREKNKEHINAMERDKRAANPGRNREAVTRSQLKRLYGITVEQRDEMLGRQGGVCALCGGTTKRMHVDHDHETGRVRAILCNACNLGLGQFKDDALLLAAASEYVRAHKPLVAYAK